MITPGALCTCRQTGTVLWVVVAQADDGQRWRLRSRAHGRVTGDVDIVVLPLPGKRGRVLSDDIGTVRIRYTRLGPRCLDGEKSVRPT